MGQRNVIGASRKNRRNEIACVENVRFSTIGSSLTWRSLDRSLAPPPVPVVMVISVDREGQSHFVHDAGIKLRPLVERW